MKLKSVVAVAVLLVSCGIESSNVDSSATVAISGKALGGDGKPLTNTKVVLIKELDIGEVVGGLFVTATTLGLACLADHPPALCSQNAHTATTDSSGSYLFSVKGRDTRGSFGVASTMEVATRSGGPSEPSALMEFKVQTTSLTLPDLRIWHPATSWPSADTPFWDSLPASFGSSPTYSIEVYDLHGNQWWVTGSVRSGVSFDGRILEDLNVVFDVAARSRGTAQGTTVDYTYVSGLASVRGHAGAPPSRGAPCAPVTSTGVGSFDPSCWLTRGTFSGIPSAAAGATGIVVDLAFDRALTLVVAKGCTGQCSVAVSSDLTDWSDAGTLSGPYAVARVTLNRSARYVRITGSSTVFGLRQVAVW